MENIWKHKYIKLVTTNRRKSKLASKPNYHKTKWFPEDLLATEMRKTKVKMDKPIHEGMLILGISNTVMYDMSTIMTL